MSPRALILATTALTLLAPVAAWAQSQDPEVLPTITVEDDNRAARPLRLGDTIDTGTTSIDRDAVEVNTPGSGDVNQLLKAIPTAQFALNERSAAREDLQDIRPENISISGGRIYDNLFVIDGIGVNSLLDTTNDNPFDFNETAGGQAQTVWVDYELVGALTVRDSNVSARYGSFTGGVVEIETRDPRRAFGMSAHVSGTNTDLTSFQLSDGSAAALGANRPPEPEYDKLRWGLSVDMPLGPVGLLAAYNRSESEVVYQRGANYGSTLFGQRSVSDNYLLKAATELPQGVDLTAQVTYSPYESEAANANGFNNQIVSNGGGLVSSLGLSGTRGDGEWSLKASFSRSNTDRDAPDNNYSRPSAAPSVNFCASTNCTEGGFGSIRQRQETISFSGDYQLPLAVGELAMGFDLQWTDAQKARLRDNYAYQQGSQTGNPSVSPLTLCEGGDDDTCVTGEYALMQRQIYRAYDAQVDITSMGQWIEWRGAVRGFEVRGGLRWDYESFLDNHNFSPRLSVARELPFGVTATLGLNRYYGRSFLGYAIRERYPDNFTERRNARLIGGRRVFGPNDWFLSNTSRSTRYSDADLNTPYSDEVTLALTGGLFGGEYRVKGVLREGRDEFSRSTSERLTYNPVTGGTSTFTSYTVTNEGETSYRGVSLEYLRDFGPHSAFVSTSFSETKTNAENYFETSDDDLFGSTFVVYEGQVVSLLDVLAENQRLDFASPFILNAGVNSSWLDGRLRTSLSARFRDGFDQIEDTGVNEVVGGQRYDVYGIVEFDPSVTANLNVQFDVGPATLDVRVDNVFDTIPNNNSTAVSQPYQLGRTAWLGLKVRY
jgi:hypothetical protein